MAFAILECKVRLETETEEDGVPEAVQEEDFHILDMDFFDDERLVIVYQKNGKEGKFVTVVTLCLFFYLDMCRRKRLLIGIDH